jgi:hypothetical protein
VIYLSIMGLRITSLIILGSTLLFSACREAKIESYRVAKEVVSAQEAADDMANTAVPTADGHDLTWTAPASWEVKPSSAMRRGSYAINGSAGAVADMSITAFPGDVGGDLANVNRWRGQIQLPQIDAATLSRTSTQVAGHDVMLTMVEMANPNMATPQRVLAALVTFEGSTWFFKMLGPDALVAAEKDNFIALLKTVKGHNH